MSLFSPTADGSGHSSSPDRRLHLCVIRPTCYSFYPAGKHDLNPHRDKRTVPLRQTPNLCPQNTFSHMCGPQLSSHRNVCCLEIAGLSCREGGCIQIDVGLEGRKKTEGRD